MYSEIQTRKSLCMDRKWKIFLCLHSAIPTRMFPSGYGNIKKQVIFDYLSLTKLALALVLSFQESGKTIL